MGKYKVEICGVNTATLPVLKSQQMTELFIQLQDGDLSAKEKLINGNLKLVLSIVQRFAHPHGKHGRSVSDRLHRTDQGD